MRSFRVHTARGDLAAVRFGEGRPLVALHALGFSKNYFLKAFEILGNDFDCLALDLPGHGDSRAVTETESLAEVAEGVSAALDAVGWDSAVLGGVSLGAAASLRFALQLGDRVELLIQDLPAFSPRSAMDDDRAAAIAEALAESDEQAALERIARGLGRGPGRALTRTLAEDWARYDGLAPRLATAFEGIRRWSVADDWPAALETLRVPTRILGLRGDPSHPYEVAETMARHIPNAGLIRRTPTLSPIDAARQWVNLVR